MTSFLHRQRLGAVLEAIQARRAQTILDLGCGEGPLLLRLARLSTIRRIVGLDISAGVLEGLRAALDETPPAIRSKVELVHGSITDPGCAFAGFDAALLAETIEHIEPDRLSTVERAVFARMRPSTVIVTTPNHDFNFLLGVPDHRYRHPDHRFEWGRARFRAWARGVGGRNGYGVGFQDIAGAHPDHGGATQMGIFQICR